MEAYLKFWEDKTNIALWISLGSIVFLLVVLIILCSHSKKINTQTIVYAGMTISASFVLSFIKVAPVTYGGSITLASMLPIMLFSYAYGFKSGLLTGVVYGLLQFIQEPFLLTIETFVLDYGLAFCSIALVSLFKNKCSQMKAVILGTSLVYAARFFIHFCSGVLYFVYGSVWAVLPANNAALYSFLYQAVYLVPDYIICLVSFIALVKTNTFKRILDIITPKKIDAASLNSSAADNESDVNEAN